MSEGLTVNHKYEGKFDENGNPIFSEEIVYNDANTFDDVDLLLPPSNSNNYDYSAPGEDDLVVPTEEVEFSDEFLVYVLDRNRLKELIRSGAIDDEPMPGIAAVSAILKLSKLDSDKYKENGLRREIARFYHDYAQKGAYIPQDNGVVPDDVINDKSIWKEEATVPVVKPKYCAREEDKKFRDGQCAAANDPS